MSKPQAAEAGSYRSSEPSCSKPAQSQQAAWAPVSSPPHLLFFLVGTGVLCLDTDMWPCVYSVPWKARDGVELPGTRVTDRWS